MTIFEDMDGDSEENATQESELPKSSPSSANSEIHVAGRRCAIAALKGFVIGSGLKGGLVLFGILAKKGSKLLRRLFDTSTVFRIQHSGLFCSPKVKLSRNPGGLNDKNALQAVSSSLLETLRYGMFLGTFAGGYCCIDEILVSLGGLKR